MCIIALDNIIPMSKHSHPYTVQMVETLISFVPPLIPMEAVAEVRNVLDKAYRNEVTLAELEEAAVIYGMKTWAHREAFGKLLESYKELFFEKLLLQKASHSIKKAYKIFQASGGDLSQLYKGGMAGILTPETRAELNQILVDIMNEIKRFVAQAVASTERERYELEISNFQVLLEDIIVVLEDLMVLANSEDHVSISGEIQQFVKSFKHGMATIEVKISFDSLKRAYEHFKGRKKEHHLLMHHG